MGLWAVDVPPSPKVQDHPVGTPVETSVNWTDWFVEGAVGENAKAATGAVAVEFTVTVFVVEALPAEFETESWAV